MKAAAELAGQVGVKPACDALGVCGATFYRRLRPMTGHQQPSPTPARALSEKEQDEVFDILCSQRFVDRSPAEVVATLVDESVYLCSERTMYRVLASRAAVQERRPQRTHPEYKKPELMATGPNQVWSWDITRLLGPKKWSYFYLYVILDIFSRYAVGWMVADRENSALAGRLIQQSCLKYGVQPRVLTLHSDRGAPMTSQCTAQLLADLGVTRSLSLPRVSDDNPFSEAQFKTLKYHPSFPGRFDDQGQAKNFCRSFFPWYNAEHRQRSAAAPPDPEVVDKPTRRRFAPSYKQRIVEEADRCTEPGEVGRLLRREGLYSSHLTTWRKASRSGSLQGLSKKRGRHVERDGLDRSELVVRELTEEALDGLLAPVLTHPDEVPGFEVEDRGHVAVALVDTNLVDRQEPEPIVARGADFAEQAPLVYLLDGVPGQAEVLGHLFDGQIPTQVLDSLLEAARGSSERVEEHVGLDSNAAIGAPHFTMRNVEIHYRLGQAQVAHPADVIAVDRFDSLPAARASRPRGLVRGERDQTVGACPTC